mmetsp:Transcript_10474/g.31274  ORF Transcript_10474/g.31274 Transcript_10474/m.31274 type:complete len:315 (+) Transcript_10474:551-1495(+)
MLPPSRVKDVSRPARIKGITSGSCSPRPKKGASLKSTSCVHSSANSSKPHSEPFICSHSRRRNFGHARATAERKRPVTRPHELSLRSRSNGRCATSDAMPASVTLSQRVRTTSSSRPHHRPRHASDASDTLRPRDHAVEKHVMFGHDAASDSSASSLKVLSTLRYWKRLIMASPARRQRRQTRQRGSHCATRPPAPVSISKTLATRSASPRTFRGPRMASARGSFWSDRHRAESTRLWHSAASARAFHSSIWRAASRGVISASCRARYSSTAVSTSASFMMGAHGDYRLFPAVLTATDGITGWPRPRRRRGLLL